MCLYLCIVFLAVMEAVQKWKTEKETRLSGDKQEEEEEESIYTVHNDEVNCAVTRSELNLSTAELTCST